MKKSVLLSAALLCIGASSLSAQYKYEFNVVKENPATPVKSQDKTGTCWCFATTSFIESELLRMGKGEHDLSEMYVVRKNYNRRIDDNYVRRGKGNIGPGSIAHMLIWVMDHHGLLPEEVYRGINYDSEIHNHNHLSAYIGAINKVAVEKKARIPQEIIEGTLDAYLGKVPEKFTYRGKEYNAESFYRSLGLNADDYVELTSLSHHPFYERVPLEIRDNWDHALLYNLPLDEFMQVIDNAINTGYTVAWDGDISEPGYNFKLQISLNTEENIKKAESLEKRVVELPVTQESRQAGYENFTTTDDHLEHITGIAKDQEGVKYYKTKNSWGTQRNGTGYHYMSENYVKAKTISILVHKNAIPKALRAKLGIR